MLWVNTTSLSVFGPNLLSATFMDLQDYWVFRLFLNLLGYASVVVPLFILYKYVQKSGYLTRVEAAVKVNPAQTTLTERILSLLYVGRTQDVDKVDKLQGDSSNPSSAIPSPVQTVARTRAWEFFVLVCCFAGLQVSYLTWGVIQEKIMTREYDGDVKHKFTDSLFLVFVNRISAFILSAIYVSSTTQPTHRAPLYKYGYSSFSNIMSSWCQYEVLKFVSFPTQVLGKASKIIPVMLMGKLVSSKTYQTHEYATAGLISLGTAMFLMSKGLGDHEEHTTTVSGLILMLGYLLFDSFTSNWQGELFTKYKMSSMQMMCGVNLFSSLFTVVSLLEQGTFFRSFEFMMLHQRFVFDVTLLSLCSAVGQLFIFFTISRFGAVTFAIIMTIRQALAIFLSCIIFGHSIAVTGVFGIIVVFVAIFLKLYLNQNYKRRTINISAEKV